jgi:hypothetical protein
VLEEIVLDTKEIDVHRIITTSFNVQLNTFIANFEEKKPSFEEVRTGGLTEIRVHRGTGQPLLILTLIFSKNLEKTYFAIALTGVFQLVLLFLISITL